MTRPIRANAEGLVALVFAAMVLVIPPLAVSGLWLGPFHRGVLLMASVMVALSLWVLITKSALVAAFGMYGVSEVRVWPGCVMRVERIDPDKASLAIATITSLFISIVALVYSFAILYGFLAVVDPGAFSETEFGFVSALYLSYSAVTNSVTGELVPVSAMARLLTLVQMIFGLLYAIIFFSQLAAFIKGRE